MNRSERFPKPHDSAAREPGPIMLRRARDVIANPEAWRLGGSLIWVNATGERVTDQLVDAVRNGRFS